jgi:flagellar protein FliS
MSGASDLRGRYLSDTISTASPGKLLVMLYDRLVLDLGHGEQALRDGDREAARERLLHAQDIIIELRSSLDMGSWAGAQGLAGLYTYLLTELVSANVRREADRVAACRELIEPLRDAWRGALGGSGDPAATFDLLTTGRTA